MKRNGVALLASLAVGFKQGAVVLRSLKPVLCAIALLLLAGTTASAGEAELAIPDFNVVTFHLVGQSITGWWLLFCGAWVICGTLGISLYLRAEIKKLPAHKLMLDVAEIIFQTCRRTFRI